MKTFYLIVISFIAFISCNKTKDHGQTTVLVSVIDNTTQKPVANATVALKKQDRENTGGLGFITIDTKTTDANGQVTFDFNAESNYTYTAWSSKPNYVNDGQAHGRIEKVGIKKSTVTVPLSPQAFLKIHLIKQSSNYVYISFQAQDFGGLNPLDTTINYQGFGSIYGNKINSIPYWINDINGQQTHNQDIYCPAFDTTTLTINF
ncbi:MAG: hypothetical protein RI955_336 [Bacteroidota bacterium]|jgi:hypothetical protein